MKALVISAHAPMVSDEDMTGAMQRFSMFMRALAGLADEIDLVHFVPPRRRDRYPDIQALSRDQSRRWGVPVTVDLVPASESPKTFWSHYGAGVLSIHGHPAFHGPGEQEAAAAVARHFARDPDLVSVHRLSAMCAVMRAGVTHPNLVFDLDDIEHRVQLRAATTGAWRPGKLMYLAQVPAIRRGERRAIAAARTVFVCSEPDRDYLSRQGLGRNLAVVPNAVRLPARVQGPAAAPSLLFLGTFVYPPNVEAAERLVTRIWPLIRARRPDASLLIAGKWQELLPSFGQAPEGVAYLGFVPDLDALYARVRVVCCPVDVGGGTRIKLIEAAGFGKPIVSTGVGAEGLGFQDGVHALIRDDDHAFAEACCTLLADDDLCGRLGAAARAAAEDAYDMGRCEARIRALMCPGDLDAPLPEPRQALSVGSD